MLRQTLTIAVIIIAVGACPAPPVHWDPMPYPPSADAHGDAEMLERLLLTGRELSPIQVQIIREGAILYFYQGKNSMLNFREIAAITLMFAPKVGHYDVLVTEGKGRTIYRYTARTEEKAKTFIDVLTAFAPNARIQ